MDSACYRTLPIQAQVAYSEVFEATRFHSLSRSVADLRGTFSKKVLKGRVYWYYAFRDAITGAVRQIYVGPDSPELRELTRSVKAKRSGTTAGHLAAQVRAAILLGCQSIARQHFRIIQQFEQAGFFRAGGQVVGSHAFAGFANMLGARWTAPTHTLDVDLAVDRPGRLSMVVPETIDVDVPSAIESLKMGFMPHAALGGASFASTRDTGLRIDFLTPEGRCGRSEFVERLKIPLQPLKFLDFLIERPTQIALLRDQGDSVVVNVPEPARFAIHKLVVSGERPAAEQAKARKDLLQAAALIEYFLDHAPDRLAEAHADACGRGRNWQKRVAGQARVLLRAHPGLRERWREALPV